MFKYKYQVSFDLFFPFVVALFLLPWSFCSMPKYVILVWENESNPSVLRHPHAPHYCSLMNPLFPLNITSLWSEPFSIAPPPLISHWFMWFDSQLIVTIYANILCLFLRWGMKGYPSWYLVLITVFYCPHLNPSPFAMLLAVLSQ